MRKFLLKYFLSFFAESAVTIYKIFSVKVRVRLKGFYGLPVRSVFLSA